MKLVRDKIPEIIEADPKCKEHPGFDSGVTLMESWE